MYFSSRRSAGRVPWVTLITLIVIGGAGFALWQFVLYPTTPGYTAQRYLTAVKAQDWPVMYKLAAMSPDQRSMVPNAEALKRLATIMPHLMPSFIDYTIDDVEESGGHAVVRGTVTLVRGKPPVRFRMRMERGDDRWLCGPVEPDRGAAPPL